MVCEVIYAELASQFPTRSELDDFLSQNGLRLDHIGMEALFTASTVWEAYTSRRPRQVQWPPFRRYAWNPAHRPS